MASTKLDNIDVIFKKVANESFNKVREVEQQMTTVRDEVTKIIEVNVRESMELHQKVEAMSVEIIEMKNERRALTNLKQKVHWASDA